MVLSRSLGLTAEGFPSLTGKLGEVSFDHAAVTDSAIRVTWPGLVLPSIPAVRMELLITALILKPEDHREPLATQ